MEQEKINELICKLKNYYENGYFRRIRNIYDNLSQVDQVTLENELEKLSLHHNFFPYFYKKIEDFSPNPNPNPSPMTGISNSIDLSQVVMNNDQSQMIQQTPSNTFQTIQQISQSTNYENFFNRMNISGENYCRFFFHNNQNSSIQPMLIKKTEFYFF